MALYLFVGFVCALLGAAFGALITAVVGLVLFAFWRELSGLRHDLAGQERARGRLYRESLEDQRAVAVQAAALIKLSAHDQLDALRRLSPEMARQVIAEHVDLLDAGNVGADGRWPVQSGRASVQSGHRPVHEP